MGNAQTVCPKCSAKVLPTDHTCMDCGADVRAWRKAEADAKRPADDAARAESDGRSADTPHPVAQGAPTERSGVLFREGHIVVTPTLATLDGGKTFAIANLTSVSIAVDDTLSGWRVGLVVVGGLLLLLGVLFLGVRERGGFASLALGVVALTAGILWVKSSKPDYVLTLVSAAGEAQGVRSKSRQLIEAVSSAITHAIAARG